MKGFKMKKKEINKIISDALETWGREAQIEMAIEEMAELTFALQKLKRIRGKGLGQRWVNVQEEIADVTLMMKQLRFMFGTEEVDSFMDFKLLRLEKRLSKPENGN